MIPAPSNATKDLNHACYHGFSDDVLCALSNGADPIGAGESGKSCLHYAAMGGHSELCSYLAQQYPECMDLHDQAGQTPLHLACRNSHITAALTLCSLGADLGARDEFGRRPVDCCSDPKTSRAIVQFQRDSITSEWAMAALSGALSAAHGGSP